MLWSYGKLGKAIDEPSYNWMQKMCNICCSQSMGGLTVQLVQLWEATKAQQTGGIPAVQHS